MRFSSTRGGAPQQGAARAILTGLAPDGGLYVPERIAPIDVESLLDAGWVEVAEAVMGPYLTAEGGLEPEDLRQAVRTAAARFEHEDVVPVELLGEGSGAIGLLELFGGPTHAFKDVALTLLPHLVTLARRAEGEQGTTLVLTATSGDTGKAALEGFRDVPDTEVVVLYPTEGVSFMQKQQMRTQAGENVHVLGIHGDFDDAQRAVKALFADEGARERLDARGYSISSANSINLGRLLPQMVYYVTGYAALRRAGVVAAGEQVDVVVPTGNFGNLLAATWARAAGVPLGSLVCATNENRVLADFFATGTYDARRSLVRTDSPSMDILVSSNLERYLYEASGGDTARVRTALETLARERRFDWGELPGRGANPVLAGAATRQEAAETLRRVHAEHGALVDPHTAVALHVLERYRTGELTDGQAPASRPALVAATASPYKFAPAVLGALGGEADPDEFETLVRLATTAADERGAPAGLSGLREAEVLHDRVVEVAEVPATIEEVLHR
ncbi:threonine synthase [Kytococcus sedentarius]|uniref:threonine synthase n=1 Tax=Kytococcus sedentarius TaxID=1276 RepID=UPI0035BC1A24